MELEQATIRPGMVLEVLDDGLIKASAPGLFSFIDDPKMLPPIMPWQIGSNCNSFSQVKQYDEVWIMNFSDNPRQLYWFRKDRVENSDNIPMGEENVEVVCNRKVGGDWATIYFSDGSGWVIGKGESVMQIRPNGSIVLDANRPHRCIDINGKNISIGSTGKSAHPAAYGDNTEEALAEILGLLSSVAFAGLKSPHTFAISKAIFSKLGTVSKKISSIASSHVTID